MPLQKTRLERLRDIVDKRRAAFLADPEKGRADEVKLLIAEGIYDKNGRIAPEYGGHPIIQ